MLQIDNKKINVHTRSYSLLSIEDTLVSYTLLLLEDEGYLVIEQRLEKEVWK